MVSSIFAFTKLFTKRQRNGQHFEVFFLCSLNKILTNVREFLIDSIALKLAIKLDEFIPKDQAKRARIKTCFIHCSSDESFLISPICLKISMLWNFYWRLLQLKIIGHCFIWQRMPRKEKLPKSVIIENAIVFLPWSEISWRAFLKQRVRNKFLS